MKRLFCLLALLICLAITPQIQKAYAATMEDSIGAEAGFHQLHMAIGEQAKLTPSPLTTKHTWHTSAPAVATVSADGTVTAKAAGTAVIYVTSTADASLFDSWLITVTTDNIGKLTINNRTLGLTVGQSTALTATTEGSAVGVITWTTSDGDIATVSADGRVTAKATGTAMIYATDESGRYTASCMVYVIQKNVELPVQSSTLPLGKTLYDQTSKLGGGKIIWTSSDPSVAVVRRGFVEAVGTGSATITAITTGGTGGQCAVTVTAPEPVASAYLNPNNPTAGKPNTLVMVGSPQYDTITVTVKNRSGRVVQTLSVSGEENYTEKTVENRTVRIWSVPMTIEEAGEYTVSCTSENKTAYVFRSRVLAAPAPELPPSSESVSSPGNSSFEYSSIGSSPSQNISSGSSVPAISLPESSASGSSAADVLSSNHASSGTSSSGTLSSTPPSSSGTSASSVPSTEEVLKTAQEWYVSNDLLLFLTKYESLCATVYYDVVNIPTIGYGQALFAGDTFYNYQTHEEAWGKMCKLVNETFAAQLNKFVMAKGLLLEQAQFDALTSYSYNMGAYCWSNYCFKLRTLLVENPDVSDIDETQLKYAFGKQSWTGGAFYTGLYRRRMDEWEMFLTGNYAVHPSNQMTGDFAVPSKADREDPNKYKSDWHAQSQCTSRSCAAPK